MCQHSAGPGLYKRHSVAPSRHKDGCVTHRNIIDSLWPGGPSLSEAAGFFFFSFSNLEHVGRFGFTAQMTVVGTLCFIKPNEMAHCGQPTDTGHRSNPQAAATGPQTTPTQLFSRLTFWFSEFESFAQAFFFVFLKSKQTVLYLSVHFTWIHYSLQHH